ncbi:ABC transporter substrate-binding protein [Halomarina litorea]|uniref:ABC transporter substrate-binding protein n=1 Tax=Halomarina litorea TaxID=2961595 RepID=UPI0020C23BE7|nr:ABC transporter substrate-binding protein [Halomarina sp. BCD28]
MTDSSGHSRRRFLQATGGAAGAAALAGCLGFGGDGDGSGGGNGSGNGSGEPQKGGTYRKLNSTITTFDPVAAGDTASGQIVQQLFDGLMNYPNGETNVTELLAKGYERSEDFKQYTFTLKDATFHNGDKVTASDFKYSFERLARSPHSVRSYFILDSLGVVHETDDQGNYKPDTLGVEAQNETTLVINLNEAFASTLQMLAYSSFAAHPVDSVAGGIGNETTESGDPSSAYTEFAQKAPIGAGPFQFVNWNKGISADAERYDDYHGQTAYVDKVHWQVIEDDEAAFQYAMEKNVDTFGIPTAKYSPSKVTNTSKDEKGRTIGEYGPLQANGETVEYLKVPEVSTFYFAFNTAKVPKAVRQAVAYVTNQQQLSSQVFKDRQQPAYHLTPPLIYPGANPGQEYDSHVSDAYPYGKESQIDEATRVMEEAGYGPDNTFSLNFTHYESQVWSEIAQILSQQLGQAHVDMSIEQAKFATLLERGQKGDLEAYTLGWIADWPAPDNFLQLIYPPNTHTGKTGVLTYTNWGRDEPTAASQKATEAWKTIQNNPQPTDEAQQARNEAYIKMEEANWEDVVLVNAFHGATERFMYSYMHAPKFGAMGPSRQKYNTFWKEQSARGTVSGTPPNPNGSNSS